MSRPSDSTHTRAGTHQGLIYARWSGHILGSLLIVLGVLSTVSGFNGFFGGFKSAFFILYGIVLNLPYNRMPEDFWKFAYGVLVLLSVSFTFIMITAVMFDYMAAAERGERPGIPGLEGTLIFLALLQVPVVLFQHKPDLLE